MYTDAEVELAAEDYLSLHAPCTGTRFHEYLRLWVNVYRPAQGIHTNYRGEKGGIQLLTRIAVAIRRTVRSRRPR